MAERTLDDFEALSFDCYGTLIDWETGIWDALQPLLAAPANRGREIARDGALAGFARLESAAEEETPDALYPEVLARVHAGLAASFALATTPELDAGFAASLPHWPAFADTAGALRALKRRYKLFILSNVHRAGFHASALKLGVEFDGVYTAEDVGSYKPDRRNFDYLLRRIGEDHGVAPDRLLHTAQSLYHDHAPARALGLATAWIDRQRLSEGGSSGATRKMESRPEPDFLFFTLSELAEAARGAG